MPYQARWFGLSLVLHFALGTAFIIAASRSAERTPRVITVTLEDQALQQLPRPAALVSTKRVPKEAGVAVSRAMPAISATEVPHQTPQQEAQRTPEVLHAAELSPPMVPVKRDPHPSAPSPAVPAVPVSSQTQEPVAAKQLPAQEKVHQRYLKEHFAYIRDVIAHRLVYPPMARKMGWGGRTVVAFMVLEDGAVQNIRVMESSGFQVLDKSAMDSVRNAAPFPRPPTRADISVPVSFRMMP